ncbi:MAG: hypothetical protein HW421_2549 [Ignavibacteria bacterium]|nr:hypothetical protein [Ignavibacteria bacterium]
MEIYFSGTKMRIILIVGLLVFLFHIGAIAQAPSFTASVNQSSIAPGENIQLTFSINVEAKNFKAPDFKGFSVLSGPNQSQNISIVNGQMSRTLSFVFVLQAGNPGKYTIGAASITVGSSVLHTNPITINVEKGTSGKSQGGNQQNTGQKAESEQANELIRKHLFIRLSVSKQSVHQSEQLFCSYKIYQHPELQLVNLEPPQTIAYNGFWSQDIDANKQAQWTTEVYNGVQYRVVEIRKTILVPQQSGKLTIEPMEMKAVARLRIQGGQKRRPQNPFDQFFDDPFFGGGASYKDFPCVVKSNAQTINVTALPANTPGGFNGAVGDLSMKSWVDKNKTRTGEPITLKIQISGKGNLKLIEPPAITFPPDFESYEPKTADNVLVTTAGISGSKVYEYLAIPRNMGEYEIEPVKFVYYDLSKKQYVTLTSEKFKITVEKGSGSGTSGGSVISGVSKEEIKYLGKDVRFLKKMPESFAKQSNIFYASTTFFGLSLAPMLLFIIVIVMRRQQIKLASNQTLLKNKRANKVVRKRLSKAKKLMVKSDTEQFYEEISRAMWGYASDKLGIQYSDLTKDSARSNLINKNIPEDDIDKLLLTIDLCEFARFAPSENNFGMERVYNDAASVITDMEDKLK